MTINVVLVTHEAAVLGCDSVASTTAWHIDPFAAPPAKDPNGNELTDPDGYPLVALRPSHLQQHVTNVMGGVQKLFLVYDNKDSRVAAVTSGLASLNGRPISSLAKEFCDRHSRNKSRNAMVRVESIVRAFYTYIEGLYTDEFRNKGIERQYWPELSFLIAGIGRDDSHPTVYRLNLRDREWIKEFAAGESGIIWAGQAEMVERLIRGYDVRIKQNVRQTVDEVFTQYRDSLGQALARIVNEILTTLDVDMPDGVDLTLPDPPQVNFPWDMAKVRMDYSALPTQYAIDFVSFLVMAQSGAQKFSSNIATVGGRTHIGLVRKGECFLKLNEPELEHRHTGFSNDT